MIRVKQLLDEDASQSWPILREEFLLRSRDHGLEYGVSNPDVLLIHQTKINKQLIKSSIPLIILEKFDSSSVSTKSKLKYSNVIGLIKNNKLRDRKLNNIPCPAGRFHVLVLSKTLEQPQNCKIEKPIKEKDLDKIEMGYTFGLYEKLQPFHNLKIDLQKERKIDIYFRGTTEYGKVNLISKHRKMATKKLNRLFHLFRIECGNHRKIKLFDYQDILKQTKIVLSPWGCGESCYRDFEAIYCGCVLLKPDSSFVEGKQDIYQNNKYYVPCNPNFSDIEEKASWILENWKGLIEMRFRALELLRKWWNVDLFTEHMSNVIKQCCDRIQ